MDTDSTTVRGAVRQIACLDRSIEWRVEDVGWPAMDLERSPEAPLMRVTEAAQGMAGWKVSMAGQGGKRKVVMVVEDDPILSIMATEMVQEAGFDAFVSDTGDAAYAYLKHHADEVTSMFVDIGLRDAIDGIALAITTAVDHPHIRICVTSARTGPRPIELPPSVKYLPKPWHALEVLDFVLPN